MQRFIRAVFILALLMLYVAASTWFIAVYAQVAEPPHAGQQPKRTLIIKYPPLFFREDWKLAKDVPNLNTEDEPEHTIGQGDLTNSNLEVHL
jgi:hypothetical protein